MVLENVPGFYFPRGDASLNVSGVTVNASGRGGLFSACARRGTRGRHLADSPVRVEVSHSVRGRLQGSHGSLARASAVPGAVTSAGASVFVHAWVWPQENRSSWCFSGCGVARSWPDVCFLDLGWKV